MVRFILKNIVPSILFFFPFSDSLIIFNSHSGVIFLLPFLSALDPSIIYNIVSNLTLHYIIVVDMGIELGRMDTSKTPTPITPTTTTVLLLALSYKWTRNQCRMMRMTTRMVKRHHPRQDHRLDNKIYNWCVDKQQQQQQQQHHPVQKVQIPGRDVDLRKASSKDVGVETDEQGTLV